MRHSIHLAIFTMMPFAALAAQNIPTREAGLWEISSKDSPFANWITCIGKDKDGFIDSDVWSDFSKECKVVSLKKIGPKQTLYANCEAAGTGKVELTVEYSGDFLKSYNFKSTTKFKDNTGDLTKQIFNVDATYKGQCPVDLGVGKKKMQRP